MGSNISPSGAIVNVTEAGGNTYKALSGISWLTVADVMNITSSCNNVAMKTYRDLNTLMIDWTEFGRSIEWFDADTVFNGTPNKATVANIATSASPLTQFALGSTGVVSSNDNARVSARYYDPHGVYDEDESSYVVDKFRVDTYAPTYNTTALIEEFSGETYRFTSNAVDTYLYNNGVVLGDADWNSALDITPAVGGKLSLQVAYNSLIYPNRNYVGTVPNGNNYSALTGDRYYYRLFEGTGPYNGGTITFHGLSGALSEIQSGTDIEVYLHLPGVAVYQFGGGFENGNIFQDLGIFQSNPGGCLAFTGGSGESVDFSFGTISSSSSNYKCFILVKIKNTNVTLNRITFSPTYA
jgi:hypothetical protein